jgi:WhiB family transcriptional regulator, redox-sensing transcriptional regulator
VSREPIPSPEDPEGPDSCEVDDARAGLPTVEQVLAAKPTGRADWDRQAACATGHDPELWWPVGHTDPAVEARRVCGGCPVLGDCREAFLARPGDRDGIWAGLRGYDLLKAARRPASRLERLTRPPVTPPRQPDRAPSNDRDTDGRLGGPGNGRSRGMP